MIKFMKRGGSKKLSKDDVVEKSNKRSVKIKRALIRTLSSKGCNVPSASENNLVSDQLQRQSFLHSNYQANKTSAPEKLNSDSRPFADISNLSLNSNRQMKHSNGRSNLLSVPGSCSNIPSQDVKDFSHCRSTSASSLNSEKSSFIDRRTCVPSAYSSKKNRTSDYSSRSSLFTTSCRSFSSRNSLCSYSDVSAQSDYSSGQNLSESGRTCAVLDDFGYTVVCERSKRHDFGVLQEMEPADHCQSYLASLPPIPPRSQSSRSWRSAVQLPPAHEGLQNVPRRRSSIHGSRSLKAVSFASDANNFIVEQKLSRRRSSIIIGQGSQTRKSLLKPPQHAFSQHPRRRDASSSLVDDLSFVSDPRDFVSQHDSAGIILGRPNCDSTSQTTDATDGSLLRSDSEHYGHLWPASCTKPSLVDNSSVSCLDFQESIVSIWEWISRIDFKTLFIWLHLILFLRLVMVYSKDIFCCAVILIIK